MELQEYIYSTKKTYSFKVGVAGDLPDDFDDILENALKKYGIISFSPPKTTPVLSRPLDFPQLQNINATYWDIELHYPTYPEALRAYISQNSEIPEIKIVVRHPDSPIEEYQELEPGEKKYQTILTQTDMGGESAQHKVGQSRVMELLKALDAHKKEMETPQ